MSTSTVPIGPDAASAARLQAGERLSSERGMLWYIPEVAATEQRLGFPSKPFCSFRSDKPEPTWHRTAREALEAFFA